MTPFWHRRICEAIFVFAFIIIGLFAWSNTIGINRSTSDFDVNIIAAGLSGAAVIVALFSYFVAPQKYQTITAYLAYWTLLWAIGAVNLTTGATESPFIATWVVAIIFAGLFGPVTLAILFIGLNATTVFLAITGELAGVRLLSIILTGELPILVSYILWHGKSTNAKSQEQAFSDLAITLDQVANKSDVVIGAISDGVVAINNKGAIVLINPAAQRIIGWDNQDALNLSYKSVIQLFNKDGTEVDKSQDPIFEVLATNIPTRRNNLQLQTTSGKKIIVEIVVSPIGHTGSGAIIVFRDITVEHQKESAQAEFISTASHEMRTPVASIEGYLGLALNPSIASIDDKAREYLTKAHDGAKHLGRLFQDLLDVTRADDGRITNKPQVINVVEFVGTISEGLRQKALEKNLQLIYKPMVAELGGTRSLEPVFFVNVDNDHLREVISNLIENAIKYTPTGTIVIDVKGDENHVIISVQDSGIGIPTEDIPHLFQKFYRVDNSETREIGGTGLGLYLCRRLVEAMKGRIWVNSEHGKGSIFYVELERISHEDAMSIIERSEQLQAVTPIIPDTRPLFTNQDANLNAVNTLQPRTLQNPIKAQMPPQDQITPAAPAPVAPVAPVAPESKPIKPTTVNQAPIVIPPGAQTPSNIARIYNQQLPVQPNTPPPIQAVQTVQSTVTRSVQPTNLQNREQKT